MVRLEPDLKKENTIEAMMQFLNYAYWPVKSSVTKVRIVVADSNLCWFSLKWRTAVPR